MTSSVLGVVLSGLRHGPGPERQRVLFVQLQRCLRPRTSLKPPGGAHSAFSWCSKPSFARSYDEHTQEVRAWWGLACHTACGRRGVSLVASHLLTFLVVGAGLPADGTRS